jgi:hypothetical protein
LNKLEYVFEVLEIIFRQFLITRNIINMEEKKLKVITSQLLQYLVRELDLNLGFTRYYL